MLWPEEHREDEPGALFPLASNTAVLWLDDTGDEDPGRMEVLGKPLEDRVGSEGCRVAVGQTEAGRYLRVIYVPDPQPDSAFVITAYDLGPKALKALRRRRRRKK